eukprot:c4639_g1_i1.p1 GENE.c4639_g1_i1~~c4639_g1_i1.p1  ORF type:complete len:647 (-),score=159.94 c4639_g1_i1:84-1973(-)
MRHTVQLLLSFLFSQSAFAFYLPGVNPQEFDDNELVPLKVNTLASTRTQLPYDYYELPFCAPDSITNDSENLGEALSGTAIHNSPYEIRMNVNEGCKLLCAKEFTEHDAKKFTKFIREDYHVNWLVDNLPAVWLDTSFDESQTVLRYDGGFPVGIAIKGEEEGTTKYYIHNHARILLRYHSDPNSFEGKRVVGVFVTPMSVHHELEVDGVRPSKCEALQSEGLVEMQEVKEGERVVWSYEVLWEYSPVRWASRWDNYLAGVDTKIHWFSIVNSLVVVFALTGLVAMIMNKTLLNDIERYNEAVMTEQEVLDEAGWKSVYGDVFRPPLRSEWLAVLVGTGAQLFAMIVLMMAFALLGFLSPANRGSLMTAMIVLFALMGYVAGYCSSRLYKSLLGTSWMTTSLMTALVVPGFVFAVFFVLNCVIWGQKSAGAVPFSTMFSLLALWFGLSFPLVMAGSWVGYLKPAIKPPVRVNPLPRETVAPNSWISSLLTVLLGGVLPFGVVFVEVFFILSSIWLDQYYYAFFFLFAVLVMLCVTCAEISIVLCYFQLCRQDYHWWWRAFLTPGASGFYLFFYSLFYLSKLHFVRTASSILFIGYMGLASVFMFLTTGFLGFAATFAFVFRIYEAIKME